MEVTELTDEECFDHAKGHADAISLMFHGEPVLVAVEAITMFLYSMWHDMLREQGMTFEEFASNLGRYMGAIHAQQRDRERRREMH